MSEWREIGASFYEILYSGEVVRFRSLVFKRGRGERDVFILVRKKSFFLFSEKGRRL